ncbi:hypothetical protein HBB16_09895 [Pseudonocardia sp. MCCB 268]|nr:hypothetical protein [Pseudonocardia cytotoxica]
MAFARREHRRRRARRAQLRIRSFKRAGVGMRHGRADGAARSRRGRTCRGFVGQVSATFIAQGLQFAIAGARADGLDEARIATLEAEARTAVATAALMGEAERSLGKQRNAYVTATVTPLLDDALHAVAAASADDVLVRLTEVAQSFAGQPLFVTVDEFDGWMHDSSDLAGARPELGAVDDQASRGCGAPSATWHQLS